MKRLLISVSVLLVFCIICMGIAAAVIIPTGDEVIFTPTIHYGDAAAAEGLNIFQYSKLNRILYWDSVYSVGNPDTCITTHKVENEREYQNEREYAPHFDLSLEYDFNYNYMDMTETAGGLLGGWYEFTKSVPEGSDRDKQVLLSDYVEFYPISGALSIGNFATWTYYTDNFIDTYCNGQNHFTGNLQETAKIFNSYFQIPVLPDEHFVLWCAKDRYGKINGTGIYPVGEDNFYLQTYSALADDAIYFIFNTRTPGGRIVDTGLIQGGYGIYCLPYGTDGEDNKALYPEKLTTCYPLDPNIDVLYLHLSRDEKKLLLHANENGAYTITVIDIDTMTQVQHITVMNVEKNILSVDLTAGENYYILVLDYSRFVVLEESAEGYYEIEVNALIAKDDSQYGLFFNRSISMDYDGDRLAVVYGDTVEPEDYAALNSCGFTVTVYNSEGLVYFATYESSLDRTASIFYEFDQCEPDSNREYILAQWSE